LEYGIVDEVIESKKGLIKATKSSKG
jgi:hypothetical protein